MEKKIKKLSEQDIEEFLFNVGSHAAEVEGRIDNWISVADLRKFLYEDEQPERVKKVFEVEYDEVEWGLSKGTFERFLSEEIKKWRLFEDANLSVRELQKTKSKDELINKINNLNTKIYHGTKSQGEKISVDLKELIDLINSYYLDSDGWDLLDEFVEFSEGLYCNFKRVVNEFKNSKGKNK